MGARLVGTKGIWLNLPIELDAVDMTIGREATNRVAISDPQLSRQHLRISFTNQGYVVEDLVSANGVRINGFGITMPSVLRDGDLLEIGSQSFRFEQQVAVVPKIMEVSRLESSSGPRPFEYSKGGNPDFLSGCLPNFEGLEKDLRGCLAALMRALPWILAIIVLGILFQLLLLGCGVLGGLIAGLGAGQPSQPPSKTASPAENLPPQPADGNRESPTAKVGIQIIWVKLLAKRPDAIYPQPVVFLKWKNVSGKTIHLITGNLLVRNTPGEVSLRKTGILLYSGAPVADGEIHEDKGGKDGIEVPADIDPDQAEAAPTGIK